MKIIAISDTHGELPDIPACDLLLIGGDVCPMWPSHHPQDQFTWLENRFRPWLNFLHYKGVKKIIGIAGNHDFVFEKWSQAIGELHLPWTYLEGQSTKVKLGDNEIWIHGFPWVPNLPSWAFYGTKAFLKDKADQIPKGIDILLSHGPPYGYADMWAYASESRNHIGCKTTLDALARVQPKAFVCGHIHEGYGHYRYKHHNGKEIDIYNVSWLDENYNPHPLADPYVEIDLGLNVNSDARQDPSDPERQVCDPDPDEGSSQELAA